MLNKVNKKIIKKMTPEELNLFNTIEYFSNCGSFNSIDMKSLCNNKCFISLFNAIVEKNYIIKIQHPYNTHKIN